VNPEDPLLILALGATGVAWALAVWRLRSPKIRLSMRVPRYLVTMTVALGLATLIMLAYFLFERLDIEYVHSYTSDTTPWYYRLAGLWGGQKGTVLLWATAAAATLTINDRVWRKKLAAAAVPDPDSMRIVLAWVLVVGLGVLLALEALLLVGGTFDRTDPYLREIRPHGTGLQPVLRTPFMIIHPPLQFIGYSFSTLLFAAGITGIVTQRREWADMALPWARFGFLISTVGLGLGGLWAYYVLNFGGYWAWDPVETANLLAWFPLLLSIHSLLYYRKRGMFAAAAPIYAVLSLLAVLFSTIATRTGLWISVHAFTDPTKNFASDPLVRLLNILETSEILRWLVAIFLAATLASLWAYGHRLFVDRRQRKAGPDALGAGIHLGASVVLCAAMVLAFLDVRLLLSLLFESADRIGLGNASIGLGILVALIGLVYASPGLSAKEDESAPKGSFWDEYVTTPRLTFLGMVLLSLAFLVTFLLQVMSVNGYTRTVYDERAPIVALPILLVLGIALAHPTLGRRRSVAWAGIAALLGIVLAAAWRSEWHLLLVGPALVWALAGAGIKLYKVSDLGKILDPRLRVAGGLLLVGGVVDMVFWANPPSRIPLGLATLHPSAWWAPIGFGLGLAASLCAVGVLRLKTVRAHRIGSLALALGIGFGVGTAAAIAAFGLAESRRRLFPDHAAPTNIRACAASLQREIRKTGVYLMHVGIVLGLAGFALSTYAQTEETEATLRRGETASIHGYEFTFVGVSTSGVDDHQGILKDLSARLEVRRDGVLLDTVPARMVLVLQHRYAEKIHVERLAREDLYVRAIEFVTPERTFLAHEENVALTSGEMSEVTFTVRTLPAMHLVWGGLWIVTAGMLVNLAAGAGRFEASKPPTVGARPAEA
jgi:cytochrome c-type biogenesis protein CcmF